MPDDNTPASAQDVPATPAVPAPPGEPVTSGTPAATPQESSPSAETPAGERPSRAQERIEELVLQRNQAIQYGDYMRQQLDALKTAPKPPAEPAPAVEQPEPEPQEDAFDDPKAYTKAYGAWARKEAVREAKAAAIQTAREAATASEKAVAKAREDERLRGLDATWNSRVAEFSAKTPDFWDKARNPALTFMNGEFLEAVKGSELGPQLVHAISNDTKLVAKLASQSVPQRLASLGRLEAELARPAPLPKVTTAPTPPSPVGGTAAATTEAPKDISDWMAWRNKQDPKVQRSKR